MTPQKKQQQEQHQLPPAAVPAASPTPSTPHGLPPRDPNSSSKLASLTPDVGYGMVGWWGGLGGGKSG